MSRTVQVWPCAGSMFQACWCVSSVVQRLGSSVGSSQVDEETVFLSATGRISLDHRPFVRSTGAWPIFKVTRQPSVAMSLWSS